VRILLYALVAPVWPVPRVRGLLGRPLRLLRVPRLAAWVGPVPRTLEPTADALHAYHQVMEKIASHHAATLPVRFGTILESDAELAFVLDARGAAFQRRLRHVRGRVQMTVRIAGVAARRRAGGLRGAPTGSGATYLRARAHELRALVDLPECLAVRAAVARWVRDERIEQQNGIVTMYHLVRRGDIVRYARAMESLVLPSDRRVYLTGPFPPFAFADPFAITTLAVPSAVSTDSGRRDG
jgi:hypothetical protein